MRPGIGWILAGMGLGSAALAGDGRSMMHEAAGLIGGAVGAALGATAGSVVPVAGTAAGGIAGGIAGAELADRLARFLMPEPADTGADEGPPPRVAVRQRELPARQPVTYTDNFENHYRCNRGRG